jgi:hypothetical protein
VARNLVNHGITNGEARKGGPHTAKAYLCGSAPVQNVPLELRHRVRRYAARASPTAGPEEGGVSKGPGGMTSGVRTVGLAVLRHLPPLSEALAESTRTRSHDRICGYRPWSPQVVRACAWRKRCRAMTGESPAPSPRGATPAYKPPVKGQGLRGVAQKAAGAACASGTAAAPE